MRIKGSSVLISMQGIWGKQMHVDPGLVLGAMMLRPWRKSGCGRDNRQLNVSDVIEEGNGGGGIALLIRETSL